MEILKIEYGENKITAVRINTEKGNNIVGIYCPP